MKRATKLALKKRGTEFQNGRRDSARTVLNLVCELQCFSIITTRSKLKKIVVTLINSTIN